MSSHVRVILNQSLELIQDFRECWKLVAVQTFSKRSLSVLGVVDTVDVLVWIGVQIVVFHQPTVAWNQTDVPVTVTTNRHSFVVIESDLELLRHLQHRIV